jgi:hypothetical protein
MAWQKATGYGRRSLVETAIGRYKHIIASALRARSDDGQGGEVAIAVHALNRMIRIAKVLVHGSLLARAKIRRKTNELTETQNWDSFWIRTGAQKISDSGRELIQINDITYWHA